MIEPIRQGMVTQAAYRNMVDFSIQARAAEFTSSKNALTSTQNYFLNQLLNKEMELTREVGKG